MPTATGSAPVVVITATRYASIGMAGTNADAAATAAAVTTAEDGVA
jgi:hypothetical protein